MTKTDRTCEELRARLAEAEETLRAIRSGEIDALVITGAQGERIFTLKGAEQPYRILIEEMREGAATLASDNTIIYCNSGFAGILRTPLERVIGARIQHFVPPTHQAVFEELLRQGRAEGGRGEITFLAGDGMRVPAYISINTLQMDGISAIYLVAVDLTERKRMEEALRKAYDELEIRVQERTAELAKTNEALQAEIAEHRRAEEELARSNAELEQFAYVASHDLQEPLRMVSGFTQLLERRYKGKLDKSSDEFIAYIVDGAARMQRMIEDLLAYSRVGTRGKPFESTDFEDIFDQAMDNLRVIIEENNATVTHDPLPTVMADTSQMIQLLQNLIGNAIKFRGEESPRVHISAKTEGDEWIFSVRDNGIGIAPEFLGRLFQLFQREYTSEYPGTGIGLAICKKIVERHGGRIWAESEPGRGSTFYFAMPSRRGKR